ncbi:putative integral membrane protein [Indibacter alkaliphilus LW1]|uniref:Integral membrane protein n=1 Tax=Indibacter alkaliphilus (strain CCUG 57479 / KCTC 22604 / LW1) TaxID=1189612 RepID=S2DJY6_INDAL|nr:TIGR00341 family protein [Indibacter alkaliphilus]EOZ99272.1 putative integral membrane protein [Indibacter alkaliphilus LW1]
MTENKKALNIRKRILELLLFFKDRFDLHEGKEDELETIDYIRKNIEFKGANLWILIFAIFVASVGLNVNSTAVIIGAMLISPLMGPIMGIGLAAGINDFELLKKSMKNLGIAVLISILTSTIYFSFTPLDDAQSELLARTEPSIWDVLIALFGGLAGIVAGSRKEKSNAIPGVAIATALMPPLCTAGYGLATANLYYFFGAFYLFFINSVFISLSTYLIVRFMNFPKKEFMDRKREKTVKTYITIFTLLTIIPSIYLAYAIVKRTIWEKSANQFVATELEFPRTQVISSNLLYDSDSAVIDISLIGERITDEEISILQRKLGAFNLDKTYLNIKQSGDSGTDLNILRSDILKDLYERNELQIQDKDRRIALLERELEEYGRSNSQVMDIAREAKINHQSLETFSMNRAISANLQANKQDTVLMAYAKFRQQPSRLELQKFEEWLKLRTKADSLTLIIN